MTYNMVQGEEGGGGGGRRRTEEGEEGPCKSSRRQLCTSLCALNNTERQDSAEQKRNRKRPMESSFQQARFSPAPMSHQVSLPRSAANRVKNPFLPTEKVPRWVMYSFRTPHSRLRASKGLQSHGAGVLLNVADRARSWAGRM